jgi:hypothetical protein
MTLTLTSLENIDKYEQPLIATYHIEGQLGSPTSKRLIIPSQFFQTEAPPRFSAATRTLPVDLHFGSRTADAVRISLAPGLHWETPPNGDSYMLKQAAQYKTRFDQKDGAVTIYRTLDVGEIFYPVTEYPNLHEFFAKVASSDAGQVLVGISPAATQGAMSNPPAGKDSNSD